MAKENTKPMLMPGLDTLNTSIVSELSGYVPYQSMFEPDGRHTYDPTGGRYPQSRASEIRSERRAEWPQDRFVAFEASRPDRRLAPPANVPYGLHVYRVHDVPQPQHRPLPIGYDMPPPPRPAATQDQRTYRDMRPRADAPGTWPVGNQGQPGYGYGGAQADPRDRYESARNNNQGSGGGCGSGEGGYW